MLFISHSTQDKAATPALQAKLLARGFAAKQLFLDSDADPDIQAGTK